jgi:TetR/AcrR family transcriptional regulator, regulator of cefoperazone and chloramphenicol sensitivity
VSEKDSETRVRVLKVATRLFAANGFKKVTVRQICLAANANVAAVNYHFGDKLGLYREVLGKAIETMRATTDAAKQEGAGGTAEDKLRAFIRVFLKRVIGNGHDSWIHQLMTQEMADPTPALDLVIDQVIRPRMTYLTEIISDVLQVPATDERVWRCVMSVQAQCIASMKNPVAARFLPEMPPDLLSADALAAHIANFSLGGIDALRTA